MAVKGYLSGIDQLIDQLIRIGSYAILYFFCVHYSICNTGIRVSEKEELDALDAHEHGMSAYPDFGLNVH